MSTMENKMRKIELIAIVAVAKRKRTETNPEVVVGQTVCPLQRRWELSPGGTRQRELRGRKEERW